MRKLALTLLGTTAMLAMQPMVASAQTSPAPTGGMSPALNCGDDSDATAQKEPVIEQTMPNIDIPSIPTDDGVTGGGGVNPVETPKDPTLPDPDVPSLPGGDGVTTPITPTPSPSPTPTPTVPGGSTGGGYVTNPSTASLRGKVTSDELGTRTIYRVTSYVPGYPHQDLSDVKTYKAPTTGVVRTIGGQKISVASASVNTNGFSSRMINAFDEMVIIARLVGVHDPIITAGVDRSGHTANSIHGKGLAVDLRANDMTSTAAKKYIISLKQALGAGYDVMYEDWGNGNTHIHVEYDGKTA